MLSVENTLLCMFQRLCTYFQDTGGTYIWGVCTSGHCSRQQISGKNEGYLFPEGYLLTGFYGIVSLVIFPRPKIMYTVSKIFNHEKKFIFCSVFIFLFFFFFFFFVIVCLTVSQIPPIARWRSNHHGHQQINLRPIVIVDIANWQTILLVVL